MADQPLDDVIDELRAYVAAHVAGGFLSPEEIIDATVGAFGEENDAERLRPAATRLTETALAAHARAEQEWPAVTDCDRLDRAFAELEAAGIVARQDFSCCGTCGVGEILDEIEKVVASGRDVRGYTFYHLQDTESAVEGHGICLSYGAREHDELAALAIGREIVSTLQRHGFAPEWPGTWDKRISVPLDWKRRRSR
jgi:hypothetical protein